jgi:hypothetical protein
VILPGPFLAPTQLPLAFEGFSILLRVESCTLFSNSPRRIDHLAWILHGSLLILYGLPCFLGESHKAPKGELAVMRLAPAFHNVFISELLFQSASAEVHGTS